MLIGVARGSETAKPRSNEMPLQRCRGSRESLIASRSMLEEMSKMTLARERRNKGWREAWYERNVKASSEIAKYSDAKRSNVAARHSHGRNHCLI